MNFNPAEVQARLKTLDFESLARLRAQARIASQLVEREAASRKPPPDIGTARGNRAGWCMLAVIFFLLAIPMCCIASH